MPNSPTIHSKHDDQGVVALEFVLVAPFLIALIFAIASFGLFFSNKVDVTSTARDAARTLALRQTPTYPTGMTASGVVTCPAGNSTSNASVTVTSSYTFSIPFIPLGTKTITATGTMRCGG
ncbi:MAG TPA: TadE/TadG family type IV pilus assembly protein [Ilumatobacteraceae bacterium]|nr:TadE/TadG family type IV pilus assembly protein [Ilumatobacteraceae bacterium]